MFNLLTKFIILILGLVRFVLLLFVLLTILAMVTPYINNIREYPHITLLLAYESHINQTIKYYIPTKIAGFDISRVVTLIALIIIMNVLRAIGDKLRFVNQKRKMMLDFRKIQKSYRSPEAKEKVALLQSKLEQANAASGKNRQELLKEFVNIKKELEKIGRDLAFLAIDVVDSTGMKQDEDSAIIEHDFNEYHNFVEAKFKEHGYIKASWTPDGVMACFNTIEEAVKTAQSILTGLEYFNKNVKVLKRDFQIRCGVNGGFVYYDDTIPLEQFSDRTIDIAGHMQKHAPANSILIAKQIIEPVTSRENFLPTERLVDGLEVCEWTETTVEDKTTAKT